MKNEELERLLPILPGTRRGFLLAAGSASLWFLWPQALHAAEADVVKRCLGSYRHVGGAQDRAARDQAVEVVVAELNFLVRPIARSRLTDASPIVSTVRISTDGAALTVANDRLIYTAPLNGQSVKAKNAAGDSVNVCYRISEGKVVQVLTSDDGGCVKTFTVDGERLVMDVRIYSPKLPKDLRYKLTYARS